MPLTYLELIKVFRYHICADFLPVNHIRTVLCEISHRATPGSLVVAAIDLLRCQAQSRHHRLRRLEHSDSWCESARLSGRLSLVGGTGGDNNNRRRLTGSPQRVGLALVPAPRTFFFSSSTARKKISRFPTLFVPVQKHGLFNTFFYC